ncbi:MAG: hypothetical protein GY811_25960 [Myxococcales bacterium]|nr:hypothetical protein [Myxococcales bacterium]
MKLVDAEITQETEGAPDIPRPPRPARRRVYTSLLVTLTVLVGTVGVIYTVFPNRNNELLTWAVEAHLDNGKPDPASGGLESPSGNEIRAWSQGIFGEPVPWPEVDATLVPTSASVRRVFKRDLAMVRYQLNGEPVSIAFWRARDAPPRVLRRTEDGLHVVSWRRKRFTCIAIGRESSRDTWKKRFGAP